MEFREGAVYIWSRYYMLAELRKVSRMGFPRLGYLERKKCKPFQKFWKRSENDVEHSYQVAAMLFLLHCAFPDHFVDIDAYQLALALLHDVGEGKSGDILDDGRQNRREKNASELECMRQFLGPLDHGATKNVLDLFEIMQERKGIVFLLDKFDFVLQQLFLICLRRAHPPDVKFRKGTTDKRYAEAIGSRRPIDVILAQTLDTTKSVEDKFAREAMIEIVRVAYERAGLAYPEAVSQFY